MKTTIALILIIFFIGCNQKKETTNFSLIGHYKYRDSGCTNSDYLKNNVLQEFTIDIVNNTLTFSLPNNTILDSSFGDPQQEILFVYDSNDPQKIFISASIAEDPKYFIFSVESGDLIAQYLEAHNGSSEYCTVSYSKIIE